ncbi:MAG TPA: histidine kinase [Gemmatimonadaceae bacterium]|nr:histidine kinase [Gemmatimonadaceae bacterium]
MTSAATSEPPRAPPVRAFRRPSVIALVWVVVAGVFVAQNIAEGRSQSGVVPWLPALWFELEYWLVFALCTPFFLRMARQFNFTEGTRRRSLLAHLCAGAVFAVVQPVAAEGLNYATLFVIDGGAGPRVDRALPNAIHFYPALVIIALWKYAVIIGICCGFEYYRRLKDSGIRNAMLEAQLAASELRSLKMQLHPHFLFNALHSAAMLTLIEPARAHRVLVQIGELLRTTLTSSSAIEVPLVEEIAFLDRYLGIERLRFEDRLTVCFEVPEELERALIPSLILQPLVENAIHHGFSADSAARRITVRAAEREERLELEVEDDGAGLPNGWTFGSSAGTGLSNVQARVDLANTGSHPLVFGPGRAGGLCVRLVLPLRRGDMAGVA